MNNSSDFYNFLFVILFLVFISYFTNKKMEGYMNKHKHKDKLIENSQNNGLSSFHSEDKLYVDANKNYGSKVSQSMIGDFQTISHLASNNHQEQILPVKINEKQDVSLSMWSPTSFSGFHGDMNLMNSVEGMDNMFTSDDNKDIWTVYGTDKCGWTKKQKTFLQDNNIQFKYVECDKEQCPSEVKGYPYNVLPGKKIIEGYYEKTS
tara:strand:- start:212 stop:829 length:618 start_codon:yes stop_codon:yes gene_type:complete